MTSQRRTFLWQCTCGHQNASQVWGVLDEQDQPNSVDERAPGLVGAPCNNCGQWHGISEPLLLLLQRQDVPPLAVIATEQLADPGPSLMEIQAWLGDQIVDVPVIAPRVVLPALLTRDLIADIDSPTAAAIEIGQRYGPEAGFYYEQFADRLADHLTGQLLDQLMKIEPSNWHNWLKRHQMLKSATLARVLDQMSRRATDANDPDAAIHLQRLRDLIIGVWTSSLSVDDVNNNVRELGNHMQATFGRERDHLWGLADADDNDVAVSALRRLLEMHPAPDITGQRRVVLLALAERLARWRAVPEAVDESIALLRELRGSSSERDELWATATSNLAVAIAGRPLGDQTDNWRLSIALLREVVNAEGAEEHTRVTAQTNLGYALLNRPDGPTPDDMGEAIDWLSQALAQRPREKDLEDWVYTKINLGVAHRRRDAPGDLEAAISHYQDVVSALGDAGPIRPRLTAELNLISALASQRSGQLEDLRDRARRAVSDAERLGDMLTLSWALRVQGDTYSTLDGPMADSAINAWQRSLDSLDLSVYPGEFLDVAGRLWDVYINTESWTDLAALSRRQLRAYDFLYAAQSTGESRRRVVKTHTRLSRWSAYAQARAGNLAEAIESLERARVRELDLDTRREEVDLRALLATGTDLAKRYLEALADYRRAVTVTTVDAGRPVAVATEHVAVAAAGRLAEVTRQIRQVPGFEDFLDAPSPAESLVQSRASRAIYIVSAPPGTFVLCMQGTSPGADPEYSAEHLDITSRDVAFLILVNVDKKEPGLLLAQSLPDPSHLDRAIGSVAEVFAPVVARVGRMCADGDEGPTVLIPTGLVGLIPLQSLPTDSGGKTLDDLAEIHLAPSLALYAVSRRRTERPVPPVFVGVADTDPARPLPGTVGEVRAIASRAGWDAVEVSIGADADLLWVSTHAPDASHLHFACHGFSNISDPAGSQLVLARGDRLTAEALNRGIRLRARVAAASACESGHFDTQSPDEYVGVAGGLLQGGAACAVVSLWPVGDLATALLMTRFYELLDPDGSTAPAAQKPQSALREARIWLRSLTEQDRAVYLQQHQILAGELRSRGVSMAEVAEQPALPYANVRHWGAFVAYGC